MSKIAFLGDIHGKVSSPLDRLTDYNIDLFKQLQWVFDYCNSLNISSIIHLGDIYDKPEMTDWWKNRFIEAVKQFNGKFYSIIGMSHDLFYNREDSLEKTGLKTLELSGALSIIKDTCIFDDVCITVLDMKIAKAKEQIRQIDALTKPNVKNILLAHQFYEWGFDKEAGFTFEDCSCQKRQYDLILGHDHRQHETVKTEQMTIWRPGSFMRTELSEETIKMKPRMLIYDTGVFQYVNIPCRDINEIYNVAEYRHKKANFKSFKQIKNTIKDIANYLHKEDDVLLCSKALKELHCPIEEFNYLKSVHQMCNQQF